MNSPEVAADLPAQQVAGHERAYNQLAAHSLCGFDGGFNMTLKRILVVLVFAALCMAGSMSMLAQSDRATITGTVTDSQSAVVPGVQVRATDLDTGVMQASATNSQGLYRFDNLPVGRYELIFTKNGFKILDRKDITLLISQSTEIDVTLQVGAATETVIITAEAPMLQTETTSVSTNLDAEAQSQLPLNVSGARTLTTFMFAYVPGVEGSDYNSHIDGSMSFSKEVLIDGTSAVSNLGGYTNESAPPMESVQESEVDTSGISADSGRSGGGVFRFEMKSGANQIHGSLFGFMHSTALDAESANNKLSAIQDPANAAIHLRLSDSLSDWGGSFGGAIKKDKLFYYGAVERYMSSSWALGKLNQTVPSNAMMGLTSTGSVAAFADMSRVLTTSNIVGTDSCGKTVYQGAIYNPATNCVFVNNQIPTSMISKTSAAIIQLFHKYYAPEVPDNVEVNQNEAGPANTEPWQHNTQSSIKIDYYISPSDHLNGSYYYDYLPRILADQGGVWSANASADGGPMANSYFHSTRGPGARLSESHTFTPNLMNIAYATFEKFYSPSIEVSQANKWDSQLGLYNGSGNFPKINFNGAPYPNGGWNISGLGSQFNDWYNANNIQYSDQVIWNRGRHNLKFGAEFHALQMNDHPDFGTFSGMSFDRTTTAGPLVNQGNTGDSFASFLLGEVQTATMNQPDPEYGRRKIFGVYASDDFKVNTRLSVNLSLRWDYNNPYKEKYGHWSDFSFAHNPVTGLNGEWTYLSNGSQSFETRQEWFNYGPHVGAAYKVTEKTVVRGNFAVYFVPLNMNTWGGIPYQQTGNPGFFQSSNEGTAANNGVPFFQWDNGYQPVLLTSPKTPDYLQWGNVHIDPHALELGNVQQYNIGVQRELARATVLDVNWIQSHSYHLQNGTLLNDQATPTDYYNWIVNGQCTAAYNADPYYGAGGGNWNNGPGWKCSTPYPQAVIDYGDIFSVGPPLGNSDYKSLQFNVTRRSANGLTLEGSYNWSRTHGDMDSVFEELWWAGGIQNIYDLKDEAKNISDFDQTHIVKGYAIYNLPFGQGKKLLSTVGPVANAVIGGWSLVGNFHYNTGTPTSVHSTNWTANDAGSIYVNLAPGCSLTNSGGKKLGGQFLNPKCYQNPANGYLGTGGNNQSQARNPGFATEDLGLHKSIKMGPDGRYSLTGRIEFFNVFNRDGLAGPDQGLGDGSFGQINGYGEGGRIGQYGLRLTF